ncbi:hypothetical protein PENSUB_8929 [Penicillium subrubescens]|uniref:Uncharacterized protein n=1 Tax=Penicillium subrubescens TaxID=1316194 RepID=A0A1Q5TFN3_9EURO|nr:hypothetical protein PENSUB_8929 [Penicillium subrubescens]
MAINMLTSYSSPPLDQFSQIVRRRVGMHGPIDRAGTARRDLYLPRGTYVGTRVAWNCCGVISAQTCGAGKLSRTLSSDLTRDSRRAFRGVTGVISGSHS